MQSSREVESPLARTEPVYVIQYNSQFRYLTGVRACTSEAIAVLNIFLHMEDVVFFQLLRDSESLTKYLNSAVETGITLNQRISDGYVLSLFDHKKKHVLGRKSAEEVFTSIRDKDIHLADIDKLSITANETLVMDQQSETGLNTLLSFISSHAIAQNEAFILTGNNHSTALFIKKHPEDHQSLYVICDSGATLWNGEMRMYANLDAAYQCLLEKWNKAQTVEISTIQYQMKTEEERLGQRPK